MTEGKSHGAKRRDSSYHVDMDWSFTIGTLTFGTLDIIVLAIILIGAVSGCITGFARQAAHLAGFVLAVPVSLLFTKVLAEALMESTSLSPLPATLIVFVCLCLIVYIVIGLFGRQLRTILDMTPIDHVLGFVWGLAASAISLSIILAILSYQPFIDFSSFFDSSLVIRKIIRPLFPSLLDMIKGAADGL